MQDSSLHISISNISRNNSKLMYMGSQCRNYKNTANWTTPLFLCPTFLVCSLLFGSLICLTISSLLYRSRTDLPLFHLLDPSHHPDQFNTEPLWYKEWQGSGWTHPLQDVV